MCFGVAGYSAVKPIPMINTGKMAAGPRRRSGPPGQVKPAQCSLRLNWLYILFYKGLNITSVKNYYFSVAKCLSHSTRLKVNNKYLGEITLEKTECTSKEFQLTELQENLFMNFRGSNNPRF